MARSASRMALLAAVLLAACGGEEPIGPGQTGDPVRRPTNLTAEPGGDPGTIRLNWWRLPPAFSYSLYWSTKPGVTPATGTRIPDIQIQGYDHAGLTPGATYYHVLTATENGVEGPPSEEVSATAGNGIGLSPESSGVADTALEVNVRVGSVYQMVSVTAMSEGRAAQLSHDDFHDLWRATISLAGLPSPAHGP